MSKASHAMQNLARLLFAIEAKHARTDASQAYGVVKVCEKLRQPLTKFAGPVGYSSLLSRALALAQAEMPELKIASVQADGSLRFPDELEPNTMPSDRGISENAGVTLVAHLLGLLDTFIGETLMITLLSDAWPSETFDTVDSRSEVKS